MAETIREPRAYELMSIVLPDLPEEETTAALERIHSYIRAAGGEIAGTSTDSPWGRRRLAYTMRHQGQDYRDGYYAVTHFSATPSSIGEIERELKLDTSIIRYLLVTDDPKAGERFPEPQEAEAEAGAEATEEVATPAAAPAAEQGAEASPAETAPAGQAEPGEPAVAEQAAEAAAAMPDEENPAPADAPAEEES